MDKDVEKILLDEDQLSNVYFLFPDTPGGVFRVVDDGLGDKTFVQVSEQMDVDDLATRGLATFIESYGDDRSVSAIDPSLAFQPTSILLPKDVKFRIYVPPPLSSESQPSDPNTDLLSSSEASISPPPDSDSESEMDDVPSPDMEENVFPTVLLIPADYGAFDSYTYNDGFYDNVPTQTEPANFPKMEHVSKQYLAIYNGPHFDVTNPEALKKNKDMLIKNLFSIKEWLHKQDQQSKPAPKPAPKPVATSKPTPVPKPTTPGHVALPQTMQVKPKPAAAAVAATADSVIVIDDDKKPATVKQRNVVLRVSEFPNNSKDSNLQRLANVAIANFNKKVTEGDSSDNYVNLGGGCTCNLSSVRTLFAHRAGGGTWLDQDVIKCWFEMLKNKNGILGFARNIANGLRDNNVCPIEYVDASEYLQTLRLARLSSNRDFVRDMAVIDYLQMNRRTIVLFPFFIRENHWVLYAWKPYDLHKENYIYYYDSLIHMAGGERVILDNFMIIANNTVIREEYAYAHGRPSQGKVTIADVINEKGKPHLVIKTPDYKSMPGVNVPQYVQTNSDNCGIFVCHFGYLISNFGLGDASDVEFYKTRFRDDIDSFIQRMIVSFAVQYCITDDYSSLALRTLGIPPSQPPPPSSPLPPIPSRPLPPIPSKSSVQSQPQRRRITPILIKETSVPVSTPANDDDDIVMPRTVEPGKRENKRIAAKRRESLYELYGDKDADIVMPPDADIRMPVVPKAKEPVKGKDDDIVMPDDAMSDVPKDKTEGGVKRRRSNSNKQAKKRRRKQVEEEEEDEDENIDMEDNETKDTDEQMTEKESELAEAEAMKTHQGVGKMLSALTDRLAAVYHVDLDNDPLDPTKKNKKKVEEYKINGKYSLEDLSSRQRNMVARYYGVSPKGNALEEHVRNLIGREYADVAPGPRKSVSPTSYLMRNLNKLKEEWKRIFHWK